MTRAADLGIRIGTMEPGRTASVLDVPGVGVGHATVHRDEPDPPRGRGVARTGVTVLVPGPDLYDRPMAAGGAVLNGAGECTGFLSAQEWGVVETPIFLTSTMQLGRVYDAACELMIERDERVVDEVAVPVVAECDDSFLNDQRRMQVTRSDVAAAWSAADEAVGADRAPAEGAVGSGTGMSCLGFKGGIGTASRVLSSGSTVGVLLMTNFGTRSQLVVDGVPVGRLLPAVPVTTRPAGSCIGIVVTDAPVDAATCSRLARRVGLGLARTGSVAHHGSGEIFLAISTTTRQDRTGRPATTPSGGQSMYDDLFTAVVESTEEAVLNSLVAATGTTGRSGHVVDAMPHAAVQDLLARAGRIAP